MSVLSFIGGIFEPAAKLVDELHTSEEEKLDMRRRRQSIENEFMSRVLDYETKLMDNQASINKAEATGRSALQRNWRPISMLTFLVLVVCDSFGWLASPLADQAWVLLQIGLGGYVAGRSAEKITSQVMRVRENRDSEARG